MPSGGRIALSTANVELDDAFARANPDVTAGAHAILTVSDTGPGLDADGLARVFEPFFGGHGSPRGAGLGLAAVHGIVKQHGGHIAVESEPAGGTRFRVYVPQPAPDPGRDARPARAVSTPPGVRTILMVEDEPEVLALAQQVLETQGYHVLAAPGPRQALEIAARHESQLHLLLTDVAMPDMNGPELADRVGQLHPEAALLFMSGYAGEGLDACGLAHGAVPLIPKPFTLAALTEAVAEALGGGRAG
jgi:two-component system, cell cycle sensor histidine kinase and response regulator CckA